MDGLDDPGACVKEYILKPVVPAASSIDYKKELNEQQLEVVFAGAGPLLVIAGAGSGKTRTLTYRVARLIESGVQPRQILLLTFTNKAAREMVRRVETLLPGDDRRITGGTYHHVGHLVLRRNAELAGIRSNFTILDREDASDLMQEGAPSASEDGFVKFPKGDVLLEMLSYSRNTEQSLEKVVATRYPMFGEISGEVIRVCNKYGARKRDLNLVDFDDLLVLWRDLLKKEEVREAQRAYWKHILVDEYQDTNILQSQIVERIAGEDGNLMVVGDDAQSIYSFRGANYTNILEFPKRHPKCKVYKLETNYRSVPEVLALANSSIRHNTKQFEKTLKAVRPLGGLPEVVAAGEADEQARFVAQRLLELKDEGIELREIAVLYRAHYQSMELQIELTRLGVPFEVRSGMRFFEQAHLKDVAAYLKVAVNGKDELAWKRILRLVPRIGKVTAEKAWALIEQDRYGDVGPALPKGARKGWEDLVILLGKLRQLEKTPSEMIRAVIEGGYESHLQNTFPNFSLRLEDLRRFADFAVRYDDAPTLLAELALTSGVASKDALEQEQDEDALVLSTIHQSKGLEWKVVFVLWLCDGKFPDARALKDEGGEEEERRLFYVAVTRAKDRLFLVHPTIADERGLRGVIQRPSRFVKELEKGTYESARVAIREENPFGDGPDPFAPDDPPSDDEG